MTTKFYKVISCPQVSLPYPDDTTWEQAQALIDFHYPWRTETPPATQFRALHSADYLYFRFDLTDDQLIAAEEPAGKMAVAQSDRVELFFRKDEQMHPYYCLEMDWKGRLLDNRAWYHRRMDYDWSWPGGLSFRSRLNTKGYTLEGALSKKSLEQLDLLQANQIETGIFRAEYRERPQEEVRWISWVHPTTEQPDFHVPSAFGVLKLV